MSTRATKRPASEPTGSPQIVQQLLAERRDLMVANERLRLELSECRAAAGKPDPRLGRLEAENRRLRDDLAAARSRAERLEAAVIAALAEVEKASRG
jgi:hypothetical protein